MIDALLYLQWHSLTNRVRARLRRLKQPKYLIGGLVGGLYFGFVLLSQFFAARKVAHPSPAASSPEAALLSEMIGALLLLVVILGAWIFPSQRAALTFTEAEIAFLFPAPVTRRTLIHYKLLRAQAAILFTTLIFTVVFSRRRHGGLWIPALGWWIMLSTLNLHQLGASFARTMLLDRGITNWQRRGAVLGLVGLGGVAVGLWAWRALPPLGPAVLEDLSALGDYARQVLTSGPLPWLLYPWRLLVRPYLAGDAAAFALAGWPALGLLAVHYLWVVRADVAFEEASLEASRRLAQRIAAVRQQGSAAIAGRQKPVRAPFALLPTGPPPVALLWKNLIGISRLLNARFVLVALAVVICFLVPMIELGRGTSLLPAVGFAAAGLCAYGTFFGPQIVRQDFRADLALADVLKLYPLRGWQMALGQLLAPALVISAVQWGLILIAALCFLQAPAGGPGRGLVVALSLCAALVLPMLNLVALVIVNAATLLFPAWLQFSRGGPRGIEVMGQQMLLALGQFVALFLALLPPGLLFVLGFVLARALVASLVLALALAAPAAGLILALEIGLGLLWIGRLFERFDLSTEANP